MSAIIRHSKHLIISILGILLSVSVAVAEEPSKFRSLYVGMTVAELSGELAKRDLEGLIAFAISRDDRDDVIIQPSVMIVPKDVFTAAAEGRIEWPNRFNRMTGATSPLGNASIELAGASQISIGSFKEVTGSPSFQSISSNKDMAVTGDPAYLERKVFIRANASHDRLLVGALTLEPGFFEASSMSGTDFAQSLVGNYSFVDGSLFGGQDKGLQCYCYVGLLSTGEGILLNMNENNPLDWNVQVFKPESSFTSKFTQTAPSFN